MATVNIGLVQSQFVYCEECNETHEFTRLEMERLMYVLITELKEAPDGLFNPTEGECIERMLGWSYDTEVYYEHINAQVGCRTYQQPVDCPNHTDDTGPHHHVDCHYYDTEEA